jgi:putative oxygen-independent coproporphyrinogen III oxidase
MAGIYIHIPFCRAKCHYCNFVSVATVKYKSDYINALLKEIAGQHSFLADSETFETIYFGGGTPSLLSIEDLKNILDQLSGNFRLTENPEITIEMNPDDADFMYLKALKTSGINRLSIGTQSFHEKELRFLGRRHSAQQGIQSVVMARETGFENISIDLIYGLPADHYEDPGHNLETALMLDAEHISAYSLTLEEGTIMSHLVARKKMPPPDENMAAEQFRFYMHHLINAGYEHYEISNYAKPGYHSKHNSAYWQNRKYLGLGAGAHSFDLNSRSWNTSLITEYITGIMNGSPVRETEFLSATNKYNEYVMTAIRTSDGIDYEQIKKRFGIEYAEHFLQEISKHVAGGFVSAGATIYQLTDHGKLYADSIAADLML